MDCMFRYLKPIGVGYNCLNPALRGTCSKFDESGNQIDSCVGIVPYPRPACDELRNGIIRTRKHNGGSLLDLRIDRHQILERIIIEPESEYPIIIEAVDDIKRLRDGLNWALSLARNAHARH